MKIVQHRINTSKQLESVPSTYGIEVDVRYHASDLVLDHDPFDHHTKNPETLRSFLKTWNHEGPLILNIKTEGIEKSCIELMELHSIKSWFFLDLSMPYFVKYSLSAANQTISGFSPNNLAVRFSQYEPIEYALAFKNKARWVWVDCFDGEPMDQGSLDKLKQNGFKICLVSPELQGYPKETTKSFSLKCKRFDIDAVCTKYPELWKK